MSLCFINGTHETFTPTKSGALATIIWECCKVAQKLRQPPPHVLSIRSETQPYPWPNTTFVDYPWPTGRVAGLLSRAERKLTVYRHHGHRGYCARVAAAIAAHDLARLPMVLFNDPELAIYLRDRFPSAFIAHWFQNSHDCAPRFRRRFPNAVNRVLAVSNFTANWVSQFYGIPLNNIQTVYNATDSEHFSPAPHPPAGRPIINFVGRTHPVKGPDLLLQAALRLAESTRDFEVQILGSNYFETFVMDDYQRELRRLGAQLESRGVSVRFAGHVTRADLPAELRKAHIHVVPARWDEPFGMTSLEGMACGLATIAARTGGTPEVVGDAALLFQRESVDELTAHLKAFVNNPDMRHEYAQRGIERARQFNWQRTWSRLDDALNLPDTSTAPASMAAAAS